MKQNWSKKKDWLFAERLEPMQGCGQHNTGRNKLIRSFSQGYFYKFAPHRD
jgi:hypothetical protein